MPHLFPPEVSSVCGLAVPLNILSVTGSAVSPRSCLFLGWASLLTPCLFLSQPSVSTSCLFLSRVSQLTLSLFLSRPMPSLLQVPTQMSCHHLFLVSNRLSGQNLFLVSRPGPPDTTPDLLLVVPSETLPDFADHQAAVFGDAQPNLWKIVSCSTPQRFSCSALSSTLRLGLLVPAVSPALWCWHPSRHPVKL